MDTLNAYLTDLGLTQTEIAVYRCGLSRGEIDVRTLVRETGIKRPTAYHALETLMQKGLVAKRGSSRSLVFSMSSPEHLRQLIDGRLQELTARKELLDQIIPLFGKTKSTASSFGIEIAQFEGIEGMKSVVEEALYCKSRHLDVIAPRKNFFSEFDTSYAKYYLETRRSRKISARTLWERDADTIGRPLTQEEIIQRNPRYLPKSLHGRFESVMMLFDDKVAIIGSLSSSSAILIHSPEINRLMSVMFDGVWEVSEPYKD